MKKDEELDFGLAPLFCIIQASQIETLALRGNEYMKFALYRVNPAYCAFLREVETRVPYVEQPGKELRPFIGIVLSVYGKDYFAPLTSPKPKHTKMRNSIGFIKIDGGVLGAINTVNMIPIPQSCIEMVDLTQPTTQHEQLMFNQYRWCRRNKERIQNAAQQLYSRRIDGTLPKAMYENCCDFALLEKRMDEYERPLAETADHEIDEPVNAAPRASRTKYREER